MSGQLTHLDFTLLFGGIDDGQPNPSPSSEIEETTGTAVNEDWGHYLMNSRQGSLMAVAAHLDFPEG